MFRKSVSFFTLVALFWFLLWLMIPDSTPNKLSFTDFLRVIPLIFSFSAFGFALLMLFIRFAGVDLIGRWIPHAGMVWWLGQHAYRFSQPSITLNLMYSGQQPEVKVIISNGKQTFKANLQRQQQTVINIGVLQANPEIQLKSAKKTSQQHILSIQPLVKRLGKNMCFEVNIDDDGVNYHRQQTARITPDLID